jgi:protein TonB
MFETVLPELVARRRSLIFYESLPVSIAVHAAAIAAVALVGTWRITFPQAVPHLLSAYHMVQEPVPPPPPPPPPAAPQAFVAGAVEPAAIVAPTVVPDLIPVVPEELPQKPASMVAVAIAPGVASVVGVPGGVVGGIGGGTVGGDLKGVTGGIVGGPVVSDGRVYVERDKPLPLHALSQAYPTYPLNAVTSHWEDSLVVRYVIGKDGRVKEVTVISHADRHLFEEEAVKAIAHWRFRPLIKDGQPVEVVHELTVNFKLIS